MNNIITDLKAPGFGGRDIDCRFTPATLILGEPFTGKTSIINALKAAMYGCVPNLGASNAATFMLASDERELFSRITMSDGRQNTLTITRDAKGGLSKTFDEQVKFPSVLLDAREYLRLTGQKRLAYVLERVDVKKAGYDEDEFLKSLVTMPKAEVRFVVKWGKEIEESVAQRQRTATSVCVWMDALLTRFKNGQRACKQALDTAQGVIDALENAQKPVSVTDNALQAAKDKLRKATEAAAVKADPEVAEWTSRVSWLEKNVRDLQGDVDDAEAEAEKMAKKSQCPTCFAKGKDWLKAWNAANDKVIRDLKTAIKDSQSEAKELQAKLAAKSRQKDSRKQQALDAARDAAQEELDVLNNRLANVRAWEQNQKSLAKAREDVSANTAELAVLKHMQQTLVDTQAKLVGEAFNTLLKTARHVTDGLLRSPLVYNDGELGMWRDKTWVQHDAFSGTEELLAYSGLQLALCSDSPIKLVVFDEFGVMPDDWQRQIAERMFDLLDMGVADQWIVLSCRKSWLTTEIRKRMSVIEVND